MRGGNFGFLAIFCEKHKGSPLRQIVKMFKNDEKWMQSVSAPLHFSFSWLFSYSNMWKWVGNNELYRGRILGTLRRVDNCSTRVFHGFYTGLISGSTRVLRGFYTGFYAGSTRVLRGFYRWTVFWSAPSFSHIYLLMSMMEIICRVATVSKIK